MLSTRLTLDTAASPTPETIRVSAIPIVTLRICSNSMGRISRTSAERSNIGAPVEIVSDAAMTDQHFLLFLKISGAGFRRHRLLTSEHSLSKEDSSRNQGFVSPPSGERTLLSTVHGAGFRRQSLGKIA